MSATIAVPDLVNGSGSRPLIVGIGGTTRASSTSESAMVAALTAAEELGATTRAFGGRFLAELPMYAPERSSRTAAEIELVETVRRADGIVIASPGYHGGPSGLVKNALDLIEDLREDERPYLDGRAVACIACATGWQAGGTTLVALRQVVHALRGWPTPLGIAINSSARQFDDSGACIDQQVAAQMRTVATQVLSVVSRSEVSAGNGGPWLPPGLRG